MDAINALPVGEAVSLIADVVQHNIKLAAKGIRPSKYITPHLEGPPGIGKSDAGRQAAARAGLVFAEPVILAQRDPGVIAGITWVVDGKVQQLRPDHFPDPDAPPCLVLYDEIAQGVQLSQNIAAQLVLDRQLGKHRFGPQHHIMTASNRLADRSGVQPMPRHFRDRLLVIPVKADLKGWVALSRNTGGDPTLRAYHQWTEGTRLSEFDPAADVCPSPRSWDMVSEILSMDTTEEAKALMTKFKVGEGRGGEFLGYRDLRNQLPDQREIINTPATARLPDPQRGDVRWLIAALAPNWTTKQSVGAIITYLDRMQAAEITAMYIKELKTKDASYNAHPVITKWSATNAHHFV